MISNNDPKWLTFLSRHLQWLAVPHISILFVSFQAVGFLLILSNPAWFGRLALIPEAVWKGEVWRLFTFLTLPITMSLVGLVFSLLFSYTILNSIESEWGSFKTTFYILVSVVFTIIFSMVFDYPIVRMSDFASTLFLAAAALFPDFEIQIYFFVPVKMKYLGWLAMAFVAFRFFQGEWMDRFFLLTIYSNYLLFFGPSLLYSVRQWKRRRDFKKNFR